MMSVQVASAEPKTGDADAVPVAGRVVRWFAALILIVYGFAKLNGSQFTILDSELDKPMGAVSGFWLTWYYFGYSPVYGNLIALVQIGCGFLLTLPRYALAGAVLLLPVVVNIVLVDVFYGVDLGGLAAAIVLLALLLWIVVPHLGRLLRAIVPHPWSGRRNWFAWGARLGLLLWAFVFTYRIANFNNRVPTQIDGVWVAGEGAGYDGIEKVFFERNRAHLAVLKTTAGGYVSHHFEVEPEGRIQIWDEWLGKGDLLFEGRFVADSAVVHLWPAGQSGENAFALRPAPN